MMLDNNFVSIKMKNGKDYIFNKNYIEDITDVSENEDDPYSKIYFASKGTSTVPISIEDMKKILGIDLV